MGQASQTHVGGRLKNRRLSRSHHNSPLSLIPRLSLRHIFCPSISPSPKIHTHTHTWISLKDISTLYNWSIKQRYTSSYLTRLWNLKCINMWASGPHIVYSSRSDWVGPRVWRVSCRNPHTLQEATRIIAIDLHADRVWASNWGQVHSGKPLDFHSAGTRFISCPRNYLSCLRAFTAFLIFCWVVPSNKTWRPHFESLYSLSVHDHLSI